MAASNSSQTPSFATTRWTAVIAAQGASTNAGAALGELCAAYYAPIHHYIECTARDIGDPRDLTQDFFARLLAGRGLAGADRRKGRFRAYLLGAVKHYLADCRDRRGAAKRGAEVTHVPLETDVDAPALQLPDVAFDRQWGLTVLDRALKALAAEHEKQNKADQFQLLKPWLTGEASNANEVAARLGMTEGATKVAIHRLRMRFRDLVKAEIAQTVSTEEEVREELRYLIEVVS